MICLGNECINLWFELCAHVHSASRSILIYRLVKLMHFLMQICLWSSIFFLRITLFHLHPQHFIQIFKMVRTRQFTNKSATNVCTFILYPLHPLVRNCRYRCNQRRFRKCVKQQNRYAFISEIEIVLQTKVYATFPKLCYAGRK